MRLHYALVAVALILCQVVSIAGSDCSHLDEGGKCHGNCTCADIKMRKSSCARLYFSGCDICNPPYTEFIGSKDTFPEEFQTAKQTIKVRSGCKLTIFSEEDYDGDEIVVDDSEDHWNYEGTIGSYECECDQTRYIPPTRPPRPPTYPNMITIPSTIEEVSRMIHWEESGHPGLQAALNSAKNKRSHRNAYILTLGSTGSGKTSTINRLFDNPNVTFGRGPLFCGTAGIDEFRIPIPIDELGISNSELRIIDTPGLLDTRGLERDAIYLATLDEYLAGHDELHDKIPNVVLIFHKFTDNRFFQVGSSFIKMLRGIESFKNRITDATYSNVIFVLSNFCTETKSVQNSPNQRLLEFKRVIQENFVFPNPIVITVAENKAAEHWLPLINGYYKLPNGDLYPRNLFDKIEILVQNSADEIGQAVIRTAFRNSDNFNVTRSTYDLVPKGNTKVPGYYKILLDEIIHDAENTTISHILEKSARKMGPLLHQRFPNSLPYLQKAFHIRNISSMADFPQTTEGVLDLVTSLRQNAAVLFLLEDAFKIRLPIFPIKNVVAGHGFHLFKDLPLIKTPFLRGDPAPTEIGYLFPSFLTCSLENKVADFIQFYPTREKYLKNRVEKLGLSGKIGTDRFTGEIRPGFNLELESCTNSSHVITAVREFRVFQLVLNDRPALSDEFKNVLLQLPGYNGTDPRNVNVWKNFFQNYGTHVVTSAYGGGAIEITVRTETTKCDPPAIKRALFNILQFIENLGSTNNNSSSSLVVPDGIRYQIKLKGGAAKYEHVTNLTKMSLSEASTLFTDWKNSLKIFPTILTTEMGLYPIGESSPWQKITAAISTATSLYFHSDLKPRPKPVLKIIPGDRDSVPAVQSNQGFTAIIQIMLNQTTESNKRFELMMEQRSRDEQARQQAAINMTRVAHGLNKPPPPPTPSCLKRGTLIHAGETSKPVESLLVGDIILDHNLNPTTVVGISYEFLQSEGFYGFDNETFFFTESHILAGPSNDNFGRLQFYVKDKPALLRQNPLMEFIPVEEMRYGEPFQVLKLDGKKVGSTAVQVYSDPTPHSRDDELVYVLQVDNPSGTYIANGYVCRHETPPLDKWRHAMAVLFKIFYTEEMAFFSGVPYTRQVVEKIDLITREVEGSLGNVDLGGLISSGSDDQEGSIVLPFDPEEAGAVLQGVFNNPTLGAMATKLYAATVKKLALYFDDENAPEFVGHGFIGRGQDVIFKEIHDQFGTSVRKYFDFSVD